MSYLLGKKLRFKGIWSEIPGHRQEASFASVFPAFYLVFNFYHFYIVMFLLASHKLDGMRVYPWPSSLWKNWSVERGTTYNLGNKLIRKSWVASELKTRNNFHQTTRLTNPIIDKPKYQLETELKRHNKNHDYDMRGQWYWKINMFIVGIRL